MRTHKRWGVVGAHSCAPLRNYGVILAIILLVVACQSQPEVAPTITRLPSLEPSPTVLPIANPEATDLAIGRSDPTAAALAAEGEPSQDAPITPLPTEATIPMQIPTSDGIVLSALYYGAPVQPASAVLLLHGEEGDLTHLTPLATALQQAGYNVMILFGRGYETSGGARDWSKAGLDVQAALETLQTLSLLPQVGLVAEGRAGIAAMQHCGEAAICQAVVLLNPLWSDEAVTASPKPLLIIVGQDQPESLTLGQGLTSGLLQIYPSLSSDHLPAIQQALLTWLQGYLSPT